MLEAKSRILVVDDYPALVTLTKHKLIQRGYDVITAQNGEDAFKMIHSEYPDLVITDVEMPVMDGYDLCSAIKKESKFSKIPVILVTSLVTTDSLMKGISAGADNYLTKPYDDDTLFGKIEELLSNPPQPIFEKKEIEVVIDNKSYPIRADYDHLINLLVSTYKNTLAQNVELEAVRLRLKNINKELELTKKDNEDLLQNVFPKKIADSLLAYGTVAPERYEDVTIMFTDFDGFSKVVPNLSPEELISGLSHYFDQFDSFAEEHNLIKIKTIGDSYMAVGGLPIKNHTHPIDTILAALRMKDFVNKVRENGNSEYPSFPIRIGIHTGSAVVGVIGKKRFAYDIWGADVNLASRMEENADNHFINISKSTYDRVHEFFECENRGEIEAKNMGKVPMYSLKRIKPEYSEDEEGLKPSRLFAREYNALTRHSN